MIITKDNFHINTDALFKGCKTPKREHDFFSKSGSRYWYGCDSIGEYVIRESNHWEFTQTPTNHYFLWRGCPSCKTSNGENEIKRLLKKYNIEFEQQKTFKGCKNKSILRFDFYIPEHNMCIEFDGKQHFEPIKRFGGEDTFIKTKINDNIKDEFCLFEGIRLIRIKYTDNVEMVLQSIFNF